MPGTDEWIAGIASYVRSSFGNTGGTVTPADVARVRAATEARKTPWTVAELEASLPRSLDPLQFKLSASHAADTASGAATLRGWSTGTGQAPGMWLSIELPKPVLVTEIQFESSSITQRGRRGAAGGRGAPAASATPGAATAPAAGTAAGAAAAPAAPAADPPPIVTYPRGYSVQLSTDGNSWSDPVAQGKGTGTRTTIAFQPTRAKFIKITQTETVPNAPAWSVKGLKIYEAPDGAGTK
jgi:hypothetical protein